MITGALKPPLRRSFTASRPSMSGRPTSITTRSTWPCRADCNALGGGAFLDGLELLVERELLDQAVAEHVVVIDDQDLSGRHDRLCRVASGPKARNRRKASDSARQDVDPNP